MSSLVATTPAQERRRPGLSLLLIALFFVVLTVRRPEGLLHPTIWAEDGWLFLPGRSRPVVTSRRSTAVRCGRCSGCWP